MDNLINITGDVWADGLLGISITQIIVSVAIMLIAILGRIFFIRRVLTWLDKLTENTESNIDDVVLDSLEKPRVL